MIGFVLVAAYLVIAGLVGGAHYGMGLDLKGNHPPSEFVGLFWPMAVAYIVATHLPMRVGVYLGERVVALEEKRVEARHKRLALLEQSKRELRIAEEELEEELEDEFAQRRVG